MKFLIIGSEGFIGKYCVNHFMSLNHEVHGIDVCDISGPNYHYLKKTSETDFYVSLLTIEFDVVINCAGNSNVPISFNNPVFDFELNSYETIKILNAIKNCSKPTKYLHLSSAAVYGNPQAIPIMENSRLSPVSPYGYHKMIAEHICMEFVTNFNCNVSIVRPFSVYGPGLKKQMFWDWYLKIISKSNHLELMGTGNESRDYIFIIDLVRAIELIIDKGSFAGEVYNIASGSETFIKDMAELFFSFPEHKYEYRFNNFLREGDPINWKADISKLRALGFDLHYSLDAGISELQNWLQSSDIK